MKLWEGNAYQRHLKQHKGWGVLIEEGYKSMVENWHSEGQQWPNQDYTEGQEEQMAAGERLQQAVSSDVCGEKIDEQKGERRVAVTSVPFIAKPTKHSLNNEQRDEEKQVVAMLRMFNKFIECRRQDIKDKVSLRKPIGIHPQRMEKIGEREGICAQNHNFRPIADSNKEEYLKQESCNAAHFRLDTIPTGYKHKEIDAHNTDTLKKQAKERRHWLTRSVGRCGCSEHQKVCMEQQNHQHWHNAQ